MPKAEAFCDVLAFMIFLHSLRIGKNILSCRLRKCKGSEHFLDGGKQSPALQ